MGRRRTNLLPSQTSFLGRTADIEALGALLAKPARLVTLVGPGGIGKTSLARRWAELRQGEYAAVSFCDLTEATDLEGVCGAVGHALGVTLAKAQSGEEAVARLAEAMSREDDALLILDNCEQVVDAVASAVGTWLSSSSVVVLATSREALRVAGEHVYEVRPLEGAEAVQLFVDRARSVRHDYVLAEADASIVAGIVRDVDGLPLAIELAAARIGMMSPSSIAENMSRRFELLAGTRRDATARHQTLRATLDWSWNLLGPWERAALAQCSLFRGGFTIEAAEAVVDVSTIDGAPPVLEVVQSLRDRSLIHAYATHGEPEALRLRLYESIREYASEKLGEDVPATERHVAHFARVGQRWAYEANEGGDHLVDRLALEFENLMAARRFTLASRTGWHAAYATTLALDSVLAFRGPFSVHLPLLDETLAAGESSPGSEVALRARLVGRRGIARLRRGMLADAWSDFEHALSLGREVGDLWTQARAHNGFAGVCYDGDRREEAAPHIEAALDAFRAGGYRLGEAQMLGNLASCLWGQGDLEAARGLFEEQIAMGRELANTPLIGWSLMNLGCVLQEQGRLDEARHAYEEAIELGGAGPVQSLGAMGFLASLHLEQGSLEEARERYAVAHVAARDIGYRMGEAECLGGLGAALAMSDRIPEAETALGRAESVAKAIGARATSTGIRLHAGHLELARARRCDASGDREGAARHLDDARQRLRASVPSLEDARFARRVLERAIERATEHATASSTTQTRSKRLVVSPDGRTCQTPDGRVVDLARHPRLRRLLLALLDARRQTPGRVVGIEALFEQAWSGERALFEAARRRVYVAVARLRDLGLRDVLLHDVDGYLLDPQIEVTLE